MNNSNIVANAIWGPMIVNKYDKYVGKSLRETGTWDYIDVEQMMKFCDQILQDKPNMVLYDVGANIGSHAIPLAKKYGNKIFVRAFEAQRKMFYMLCGNVALNSLDNVVCENIAVTDVDNQTIIFNLPDYHKENNFAGLELITAANSDNQDMIKLGTEEVKTATLDGYGEQVDFVKMDIEGMEHVALKRMTRILSKNRPICLVEMRKTDKTKVIEIFDAHKYKVYKHTEFDWLFVPEESRYQP